MEAQQLHRGRLIDHVHLIARDLEATKRFYAAVLHVFGRKIDGEGNGFFHFDEFFISDEKMSTTGPTHVHIALQAPDRATVDRFHATALAAGGKDHGKPGVRPQYHAGYYGAFVLDPDGNNIEAVYHGPAKRSAASVVITFDA